MHVLALVDDLMFASRIREAARGAGLEVRTVRDAQAALEHGREDPPALVLLDLDRERLRPVEAVRLLRGEAPLAALEIVGFVSHVNEARIREAEEAGCTRVLSRGAFVRELPGLMARAAGRAGRPDVAGTAES
jgi:CheY-like chemotaxis protein